jgi:hypothetical protein
MAFETADEYKKKKERELESKWRRENVLKKMEKFDQQKRA